MKLTGAANALLAVLLLLIVVAGGWISWQYLEPDGDPEAEPARSRSGQTDFGRRIRTLEKEIQSLRSKLETLQDRPKPTGEAHGPAAEPSPDPVQGGTQDRDPSTKARPSTNTAPSAPAVEANPDTSTSLLVTRLRKVGNVKVTNRGDVVMVTLAGQFLFEPASDELQDTALETLKRIGSVIKQFPDRDIRVRGHTDSLPIDTPEFESNWELSGARAIAVLKYLVYAVGVRRDRIGAVAMGQFHPLVPNTSPERRRKNRRVEILLYPEGMVPDSS